MKTKTTLDPAFRRYWMLTMRLHFTSVDEPALKTRVLVLESRGVCVSTLQRQISQNEKAIDQAYLCHNACRKKQPPVELRQAPLPFDSWLNAFVVGTEALPALYFLAMYQQEIIGVCVFVKGSTPPGFLESGFTGVLPGWTGQGIAGALKAHSLLCIRQQGFQGIETSNLLVNRSMYAINRSLGFEVVKRNLHSYPVLPPE